jgi:hypothetical protein
MSHQPREITNDRDTDAKGPITLAFHVDGVIAAAAEHAALMRGLSLQEWLREVVHHAINERRRGPRNVRISRKVT